MIGYKRKERFIVNVIFYGFIGILIFAGAKYLLPVLMPFFVGLVVALILQPPVRMLSEGRPHLKRIISIALCALFYLLCGYLLVNFGVQIFQKAGDMIARIPSLYETQIVPALWIIYEKIQDFAFSIDPSLVQEINRLFNDLVQNMRLYITEYSMKGVSLLTNTLTVIPGVFLKVLLTIISSFFMMADFDHIVELCKKMIPKKRRETVETTTDYIKNIIGKYIKSYSLIFCITFLELSIGFTVLGISNSILIGLCVAIFDILPILGTGGILIPWSIISLIWGNKFLAVGLIVLYIVVVVVRNIIEPRIVGKQIGLHPLVTLVVMFVGLKFFGIIGLFGFPIALSVFVNLDRNDIIHIFPHEDDETKPLIETHHDS